MARKISHEGLTIEYDEADGRLQIEGQGVLLVQKGDSYASQKELLSSLVKKVIRPAEEKADEIQERRKQYEDQYSKKEKGQTK